MRKIKTVKIDLDILKGEQPEKHEYTIKEMTCQNIIDLLQTNSLFKEDEVEKVKEDIKKSEDGKDSTKKSSFLEEIVEYGEQIQSVMDLTCDFKLKDLKPLSPSEIKQLFDAFKEVNEDFLDLLEKLKITETLQQIMNRAISSFSKMLAI